jgi:2-oxo-4-hydroxy-4-carboxy-5-ureidoimidazoline decarboxylase
MSDPHAVLNALPADQARAALARCCGAERWVAGMLARRPWTSTAALYADAETTWAALGREDFLEAFGHHPRIGARGDQAGDGAGDKARDPGGAAWSRQEQARVADADAGTRRALGDANERYLRRFGHIFIVCATGKSAAEMLSLLEERFGNDPARELAIAAGEQARITRLRLEKLGA